jgi:hypothetical protein
MSVAPARAGPGARRAGRAGTNDSAQPNGEADSVVVPLSVVVPPLVVGSVSLSVLLLVPGFCLPSCWRRLCPA